MSSDTEVIEGLSGLDAALFALFLAESLKVVFSGWASDSTRTFVLGELDQLWEAVARGDGEVDDPLAEVDEFPEADVDDSHRRDYYVMRCLGLISYVSPAVRLSLRPADKATSSLRLLGYADVSSRELIADLSAAASRTDEDAAQDLRTAFRDARVEVLSMLRQGTSESLRVLAARVRNMGERVAAVLGATLPVVAASQGWRPD